jgi:formylglycine-generating enzyme
VERRFILRTVVPFLASAVLLVAVVVLAYRHYQQPSRCSPPFVAKGARCCAPGQSLNEHAQCIGIPTQCSAWQQLTPTGCEAKQERVLIPGGALVVGPSDWEAQGIVQPRNIQVSPFYLDKFEVGTGAWMRYCQQSKTCPAMPLVDSTQAAILTVKQLKSFCNYYHGRLPTDDEWLIAVMGTEGHRYPWGNTGAVCHRAAFGLVHGMCAHDAVGPDTMGTHASGQSAQGVFDLAGNVAEWTQQADGTVALHGGSFQSDLAAELRGWHTQDPTQAKVAGGRCAYDVIHQ